MTNETNKPVMDDLRAEVMAMEEHQKIIVSKLKRWQDQVRDKQTAVMISQLISNLGHDSIKGLMITLAAVAVQSQILSEKEKPE